MLRVDILQRGLTVRDVAYRYRVSPDKVRSWIKRGELPAINTATPLSRPRWVILPDALAAWERSRQAGPTPKPIGQRRRQAGIIDYYPD